MEQRFSNIEECNDYIEFLEMRGKPIPAWIVTEKERIERENAIPDTEYIFGTMAAHNPFMTGKNGKTDPLKTEESDPLKLSLPKSKKLSSVLGSKRSRFSPIKLYYLSLFPVRTGHFAKIDISPNIFMSGPI